MKVETGGLIFDDSDKRCTIIVRCAQKDGVASYLACISCVDASSGGIKWYYGFTDSHLLDYDDDTKRQHITYIMRSGGKVYSLLEDLETMAEYLKGLKGLNLNEYQ